MKTIIQRILVEENHSFACRTYETPQFETSWHKHDEFEIIVITEGFGTVMLGDYIGAYNEGDVFYIAGNLPHWFRKNNSKMHGKAVVAQFRTDIFGTAFLHTPEIRTINNLLIKDNGFRLTNETKTTIGNQLITLENSKGFKRMEQLLSILHTISITKDYEICSINFESDTKNLNPAIEKIIDYSFKHYLKPIVLKDVADIAEMSIPTFCRFFKKNIKKTYFEFLQELRINHACKLLKENYKPIIEICYESGYNSWAHFSKQFKQVTLRTPSSYRKEYSNV